MSERNGRADRILAAQGDLGRFARELDHVRDAFPRRVSADPEKVERGLAQLVLTLVELLRQLMERQALRRLEQGTLSDDEVERLRPVAGGDAVVCTGPWPPYSFVAAAS